MFIKSYKSFKYDVDMHKGETVFSIHYFVLNKKVFIYSVFFR